MISLTATIRPLESVRALNLFGRSIRRFWHLPAKGNQTLMTIPQVGKVLLGESAASTSLDMVATDEASAQTIVAVIEDELRRAVPGREYTQSFSLQWARPATIPPLLR